MNVSRKNVLAIVTEILQQKKKLNISIIISLFIIHILIQYTYRIDADVRYFYYLNTMVYFYVIKEWKEEEKMIELPVKK